MIIKCKRKTRAALSEQRGVPVFGRFPNYQRPNIEGIERSMNPLQHFGPAIIIAQTSQVIENWGTKSIKEYHKFSTMPL